MLDPRPGLIIGVRILDPNVRFQFVAAADQSPALDNVEFFGMWGPVIIDKGLLTQSDGVDNERIALIVADRLAVPGDRGFLGMGYVEIYPADLLIS